MLQANVDKQLIYTIKTNIYTFLSDFFHWIFAPREWYYQL